MLLGIAPSKLQWSIGTNTRAAEIVVKHASRDLNAVNENLDSRCATRTVVRKEDMFPRVVEWKRLQRGHANCDVGCVVVRCLVGMRFFRFFFRRSFCLCLLLSVFLRLQLLGRLVRRKVLFA